MTGNRRKRKYQYSLIERIFNNEVSKKQKCWEYIFTCLSLEITKMFANFLILIKEIYYFYIMIKKTSQYHSNKHIHRYAFSYLMYAKKAYLRKSFIIFSFVWQNNKVQKFVLAKWKSLITESIKSSELEILCFWCNCISITIIQIKYIHKIIRYKAGVAAEK